LVSIQNNIQDMLKTNFEGLDEAEDIVALILILKTKFGSS